MFVLSGSEMHTYEALLCIWRELTMVSLHVAQLCAEVSRFHSRSWQKGACNVQCILLFNIFFQHFLQCVCVSIFIYTRQDEGRPTFTSVNMVSHV